MSERCKHKNGFLIEFMFATHTRVVIEGKLDDEGVNENGDITGYSFDCSDCKKEIKYKFAKSPKWFRNIVRQLHKQETEVEDA